MHKTLIIFLFIFSFAVTALSQNKIKVRKSDTTFNAFFYSEKIYKHTNAMTFRKNGSANGSMVSSKKSRTYYVFTKSGNVFFFYEKPNFKKVKKWCSTVDWNDEENCNGKYFISGEDLVIFPYSYNPSGDRILSTREINGNYFQNALTMNSGTHIETMLLLE